MTRDTKNSPEKFVSSKRNKRLENKRKKMAALIDISKLNEYDRQRNKLHKPNNKREIEVEETKSVCSNGVNVVDLRESLSAPSEPSPNKKLKIEDEEPPLLGASGKPRLEGEEYLAMKKKLRERTKDIRGTPKFRLRDMGERASLKVPLEERCPLFLSDIQHLVMYSMLGVHSPYSPSRWCSLEKYNKLKNVNIMVVENVSLYHYENNESHFPFLNEKFENKVEFVTPVTYSDVIKELSLFPVTTSQMKKLVNEYGSLEDAEKHCTTVFNTINNFFTILDSTEEDDNNGQNGLPKGDKFSRTQLLLSGWQMIEENFPLPIKGFSDRKYPDYKLTKDKYKEVTSNSPMIAIDCEMCRTETGDLELTRISAVNEEHKVIYDSLVKPDNKITDYLTRFSGINSKMLKNVTKKLKDVQEDFRNLLPDNAILVGQSLSNDLHAMKMMHPYVIDTSVIFNITGDRQRKTKLQTLAREFLREKIQVGHQGHSSAEDSCACMKLVQLKLKHHLFYGDATMGSNYNELRAYPEIGSSNYAKSMLQECTKVDKTVSVVGVENIGSKYRFFVDKTQKAELKNINCDSEKSNKDVVQSFIKHINDFSLNIAHLRIAETSLDNTATYDILDQWIGQVVNKAQLPNLTLVIFSGQKDGGNGVSFIKLNKEFID